MSGFGPPGEWASCLDQLRAIQDEQQKLAALPWASERLGEDMAITQTLIDLLSADDPHGHVAQLIGFLTKGLSEEGGDA
jgi:hypothetical protein